MRNPRPYLGHSPPVGGTATPLKPLLGTGASAAFKDVVPMNRVGECGAGKRVNAACRPEALTACVKEHLPEEVEAIEALPASFLRSVDSERRAATNA